MSLQFGEIAHTSIDYYYYCRCQCSCVKEQCPLLCTWKKKDLFEASYHGPVSRCGTLMTWIKARRRTCTPSVRCACARSVHAGRWNSSTRCLQYSRSRVGLRKLLALRSTEYLTDRNKHHIQLHLLSFTEHLIDRAY